MNNRTHVEKVIVVKPSVAVPSTTTGPRLYDVTTSIPNLLVGSVGAYLDTAGSGNPTAMVTGSYAGQPFRFIQRRDTSNDPNPLPQRAWEMSQYIHGECIRGIEIAGQAFTSPTVNSWLFGAPNTFTAGNIRVSPNNLYLLNARAMGWRTDLHHSMMNAPTTSGRSVTPDFTALGITTTARQRDYLIKDLAKDFNRKNSLGFTQHGVAICIDTAGTTTTGPTIASVIAAGAGNVITIGYDSLCQPVKLLITADRLAALVALEAKLTTATGSGGFGLSAGAAKIALYAMPDQGCASAIELAGSTASTADMIFVMAIDEAISAYDDVAATKKRLDMSLDQGALISDARKTLVTLSNEGSGLARNLTKVYEDNEHYRSYTSTRKWGANSVAYPDFILDNEVYDIYTITHCHNRNATGGGPSESPLITTLAVVHTNRTVGTTPFSTGAANPQKTYIEAVLNAVGTYFKVPGPINL